MCILKDSATNEKKGIENVRILKNSAPNKKKGTENVRTLKKLCTKERHRKRAHIKKLFTK